MVLLAITTDTWIVTGLGFGIVLALLICLVFIMLGFGAVMKKITAPKAAPAAPKAEAAAPKAEMPQAAPETAILEEKKSHNVISAEPTDEGTKAAIAMALYLAQHTLHDIPAATIMRQARNTAWNTKSIGLNNVGF